MLTERDTELLSAYLDGALTEPERIALESRLASETDLRRELEALRATVAILRALPVRRAPHNFTLTPAQVRPRASRWLLFPTTPTFSALSAVAAVILFALSAVLFTGGLSRGQLPMAAPADEVAMQATLVASPVRTPATLKANETGIEEPAILVTPMAAGTLAISGESVELFAAAPPQPTAVTLGQTAQSNLAAPTEDRQMEQATLLPTTLAENMADAVVPGAESGMAAPAQSGAGSADSAAEGFLQRAAETGTPTPAPSPALTMTDQFRPSMTPSMTLQPPVASPTVTSLPPAAEPESVAPGPDWLPLVTLLAGAALLALALITTFMRRRSR